ncbi:hypothetical protein ACJX0J_028715, partial [Zea mays]
MIIFLGNYFPVFHEAWKMRNEENGVERGSVVNEEDMDFASFLNITGGHINMTNKGYKNAQIIFSPKDCASLIFCCTSVAIVLFLIWKIPP